MPTNIVAQPVGVEPLAPAAVAELAQIVSRVRDRLTRTASDIIEIGLDLLEAKSILGHGRFGPWIDVEFDLSHRSATQFMRAAERFGSRLEAAANLPAGVLLELASPSVPEPLVSAVLDGRVEARVSTVREQVRRHRIRTSQPRTPRDLLDVLWSLPDAPEEAAEVLARVVLEYPDDLAEWASMAFSLAADAIEREAGQS